MLKVLRRSTEVLLQVGANLLVDVDRVLNRLELILIVCLRLNQPSIHLSYISRYITFSYTFRCTSAPSSGSLILKYSIFDATASCKHVPKRAGKMRVSRWSMFSRFHENHL